MARYEMKDLSYPEYQKFCKAAGIEPVDMATYCTGAYQQKFFTEQKISNAVWDENGVEWFVRHFGNNLDPDDTTIYRLVRTV